MDNKNYVIRITHVGSVARYIQSRHIPCVPMLFASREAAETYTASINRGTKYEIEEPTKDQLKGWRQLAKETSEKEKGDKG